MIERLGEHEWVDRALALRDQHGCAWFATLTAIDDLASAELEIVLVVGTGAGAPDRQLRCRLGRQAPQIHSVAGVWAGAGFAERETAEMFGVRFVGHPDPRPLLLPPGVSAPLRRDAGLSRRAETSWPGAHEPADRDRDRGRRRPMRAMGSDEQEWQVRL